MIIRPILEPIVEEIKFEDLPSPWNLLDVKSFSKGKELWDFQQNALKNAIKCLYLYFKKDNADKSKFYQRYVYNGLDEDVEKGINIKLSNFKKKISDTLRVYFPVETENSIIKFENFINRQAFWMATGSGKTLLIIKIIEILKNLMDDKEIPKRDILFLTHREDLINQFKKFVDEFNKLSTERGFEINLRELTEYESIKRENLFFSNTINVFYYRSDLISDEQKEKIIDFKNYENSGQWYIILDEAHKGDKEDSKRQLFYSIMSRNGFLFNFSATFVHPLDIITTIFNFNLEKFISEGFGKHIYLFKQELRAFKEKEDYNKLEKKKIVLKALILLTYIKKFREKIPKNFYHEPLMITLVNTVNLSEVKEEESDLKLFFDELESIGKGEVSKELLQEAINELLKEFSENTSFIFEKDKINIKEDLLKSIALNDIMRMVYNSDGFGSIEALTIPKKSQEVILKLKTSDKPFALIKVGDALKWVKDHLKGYEINESYEDKSIFENLEEKKEINILMGSRAFYEGWDSNRPNLALFVNIGVGANAKKFVLQSIGRGVRIEPIKNKRKRLISLFNEGRDEGLLRKIDDQTIIQPLETLFIFGTNRNALKEITETLEIEKRSENIELAINEEIQNCLLLVPVYKESTKKLYLQKDPQKFLISSNQFEYLREFLSKIDDRIILTNYNVAPELLLHIKESFKEPEKFYKIDNKLQNVSLKIILSKIIKHFDINIKELEKFKKLENEIIHFKKITLFFDKPEELEELKSKINKVLKYPKKQQEEKELKSKYGKVPPEEYTKLLEEIREKYSKEEIYKDLKLKYIANHYYLPLILSTKEKINYIKHIIKTESEVKFISQLEDFIKNNQDKIKVDWWAFSKIDEYLDEVYIPYYDPQTNSIQKFKPDFIFWIKNGKDYYIVFVDPKGITHTEYELKVDGFARIFEENKLPKTFKFENLNIKANLYLFTHDKNRLSEGYKKYWFDNPSVIFMLDHIK